MLVSAEQIQKGATSYYEEELCKKASGIGKFATYFVLPSISGMVQQKLNEFRYNPLVSSLYNGDGLVDIDLAKEWALSAMNKCGSIDTLGFKIGPNDVNLLYDYIRRA